MSSHQIRRVLMPPGRAITSRAPLSSGQKNSHTDTSKLNGVFCSTTSICARADMLLHPLQPVDDASCSFIAPLGRPVDPEV